MGWQTAFFFKPQVVPGGDFLSSFVSLCLCLCPWLAAPLCPCRAGLVLSLSPSLPPPGTRCVKASSGCHSGPFLGSTGLRVLQPPTAPGPLQPGSCAQRPATGTLLRHPHKGSGGRTQCPLMVFSLSQRRVLKKTTASVLPRGEAGKGKEGALQWSLVSSLINQLQEECGQKPWRAGESTRYTKLWVHLAESHSRA